MRFTESPSAFLGSTPFGACLQPEQGGDGLQVVLDPVMDLLSKDPAKSHPAVLERHRRLVRDRIEQLAIVVVERGVAIDDELADLASAPAQGQSNRVLSRPPFGPGDAAVLEHNRGPGRAERLDGGLHDRFERLLQIEALGDRLRDASERLELFDPAPSLSEQLRVLDRLPDLRGDRLEQTDLGVTERTRLARSDVQGALERVSSEDRDGEDRLVVVLGQVGKRLEAWVEVGLRRDHHGRALGRCDTRDSFTAPHARGDRRVLDEGPMGRAQHELVGALVVQVHEARIGAERSRDLVGDRLHHLLQVERRVDDLDRAGEERQVTGGLVRHRAGAGCRQANGRLRRARHPPSRPVPPRSTRPRGSQRLPGGARSSPSAPRRSGSTYPSHAR